ncbi:adenylate/guanylate cyclase domain-containing protein [Phenylobacterium sp.]|uniref:adenylate/guanylate cyclase domain-containing protein n=1 Tax=Phenylobacterium sp. TaxID=1871053 RepID=UPI0025D4A7A1|nr:adenylate/guanylate cyclase domain-containing protein [Phenylobacterium sp.]
MYFETPPAQLTLVSQLAAWLRVARQPAAAEAPVRAARRQSTSRFLGPAKETVGACGCCADRVLSRYVSPQVIDRLMADPDGLSVGGETRDVTVLFADLRGFTALAEAMKDKPRRLNDLINAFLDPMTDIVLAHGGTIDKYMGDCVMAFWGAPYDDPDHAKHAFEAARAMLLAMEDVNRRVRASFAGEVDLPTIRIGIGINSGECVVGALGSRNRFDYSVLGDPVNIASRIEGLCKVYDIPLLIGEETARRLPPEAGLAEIGRLTLRGRTEKQWVFGIAALGAPSEPGQ